jgi:chemotaxis protein methyltransferase CheR
MIDDFAQWNVRIDATDIDRQVLRTAEQRRYGERSMKDTPLVYRDRHFGHDGEMWRVNDAVAQTISFSQLNLMDRAAMRKQHGYDFIFCRNVLIYFDDTSRKQVVNALYDALLPGGYLFLGSSESVGRITAAFQLERVDDFLCYKRA